MKSLGTLRQAFAQNDDTMGAQPALKLPRRASSPVNNNNPEVLQPLGQNRKSENLVASDWSLPSIEGKKAVPVRREKTFHTYGSNQPTETTTPRRQSLMWALPIRDDVTDSPPELNIAAKRFATRLLSFASKLSKPRGSKGLSGAATTTASFSSGPMMRPPSRLLNLFRSTALSIQAWMALYKIATQTATKSYNLSDIMALTSSGGGGGGGGGGGRGSAKNKEVKKSTTTVSVDYEGNVVKFNMDDFKSNITMKLTERAKKILTKLPNQRSDDDIRYVMIALKSVPQISEYPLTILNLIVKFGFFESFEARRVLIRQGHVPTAFYFILYGDVAVAIGNDDNPMVPAKLAVKLKRGESFGELAIITGSPRQSTCVTLGYCEFIKLWKEEFVQIFKVGGMSTFNNIEVMSFLRGSELMVGWPLDLLKMNPEVIHFAFFKAGSVIVNDIRKSKWLVILKSGRADAIAVTKRRASVVSEKTGRLLRENEKSARQALSILFHLSKQEFDRELTSSRFHKISSTWTSRNNLSSPSLSSRMATNDSLYLDDDEIAMRAASLPAVLLQRGRKKSAAAAVIAAARGSALPSLSRRTPTSKDRRSSRMSKSVMGTAEVSSDSDMSPERSSPGPHNRISSAQTAVSLDTSTTDEHSSANRLAGRKTMFNVINQGEQEDDDRTQTGSQNASQNYIDPRMQYDFIAVQQLGAGNIFGLQNHLKLTDARLLLLSQGCECILLNWHFFRQHCSNVKMAQLQTWAVSSDFPNWKGVEELYQDELNWNSYRKFLVKSATVHAKPNSL